MLVGVGWAEAAGADVITAVVASATSNAVRAPVGRQLRELSLALSRRNPSALGPIPHMMLVYRHGR